MGERTSAPAKNTQGAILTCFGRLSYPALIKPRGYKNSADKFYQATLLVPKPENIGKKRSDDKPFSPWGDAAKHNLDEVRAFLKRAEEEMFPGVANKKGGTKSPIFDGDKEGPDGEEPEESKIGHFWFRTKTKRKPVLLRADKSLGPVTDEEEINNLFAPGYWVRMQITAYDGTNTKPGVGFGLNMVQALRADNTFSSGTAKVDIDALPDLSEEDLKASEDLGDMQ